MNPVMGEISGTIPISLFNNGMAGEIFSDVRRNGAKVVMSDDVAECVLLAPEAYEQLMNDIEDARLLAVATERMNHYDPSELITQEDIDREFGFTPETLKDLDEVELE